ncbi:hypothetical protein Bbelb_015150 [Branchiostoma belcheri]|nr:hypothetical protein Bbelb_015150 [Branchiostoma belcheri]
MHAASGVVAEPGVIAAVSTCSQDALGASCCFSPSISSHLLRCRGIRLNHGVNPADVAPEGSQLVTGCCEQSYGRCAENKETTLAAGVLLTKLHQAPPTNTYPGKFLTHRRAFIFTSVKRTSGARLHPVPPYGNIEMDSSHKRSPMNPPREGLTCDWAAEQLQTRWRQTF